MRAHKVLPLTTLRLARWLERTRIVQAHLVLAGETRTAGMLVRAADRLGALATYAKTRWQRPSGNGRGVAKRGSRLTALERIGLDAWLSDTNWLVAAIDLDGERKAADMVLRAANAVAAYGGLGRREPLSRFPGPKGKGR